MMTSAYINSYAHWLHHAPDSMAVEACYRHFRGSNGTQEEWQTICIKAANLGIAAREGNGSLAPEFFQLVCSFN